MPHLTLQDLPPRWAHFCLDIAAFVHREVGKDLRGQFLFLGLSRGVDSTALLLWAHLLQPRLKTRVHALHVYHGLRPEADEEADSLHRLCCSLDIPLHKGHTAVGTYAARQQIGLEEAGRRLRYRFLLGSLRRRGGDLLLVGHHLNDLAEDMLMRQLRGVGWPALGGMLAWEASRSLLRPFLLTPKQRLQDFVQACGYTWLEDASNQDQSFTRNRIRHQILPRLLAENPGYLHQVASLWRQARIDADFWDMDLQELVACEHMTSQGILLPARTLLSLHPAQRLRWYRSVLKRLGPGQVLAETLFQVDRAWRNQTWRKRFQFPGDKEIMVSCKGLICFVQGSLKGSSPQKRSS